MPAKELVEAQKQVEQALKLLDTEAADEIIIGIPGGTQPEEYGVLVRGTQAAYHMLWMLAKGNGMRQNKTVLRMGAQALTILLTLVHYAYALGVRRGRELQARASEKES